MEFPEVTRLHKYFSFNEYSLSMLVDRAIWAATTDTLNDPFELQVAYLEDALPTTPTLLRMSHRIYLEDRLSTDEITQRVTEDAVRYENLTDQARREILEGFKSYNNSLKENAGIFSLTCCYNQPEDILMWAHYGDSHKGFVVGYERADGAGSYLEEGLLKVEYNDNLEPRNINEQAHLAGNLITKSEIWRYEREFRLVYRRGGDSYALPGPIKSITFGLKMPPAQMITIKNSLENLPDIEYFQTISPQDQLTLEYNPVTQDFFSNLITE